MSKQLTNQTNDSFPLVHNFVREEDPQFDGQFENTLHGQFTDKGKRGRQNVRPASRDRSLSGEMRSQKAFHRVVTQPP